MPMWMLTIATIVLYAALATCFFALATLAPLGV